MKIEIYFVKCRSGYWAGFSHEEKKHLYAIKKENGAKFFDSDEAVQVATGWLSPDPLIQIKIEAPLEPFVIEGHEYLEII